ncbi:TetR/AcrR family transcriptional regulator [Levilactobacillus fujinensis]|uniref:TetR/AcrR family transcriptional regulator n=1 Tax=Levilactobacillus fujinensis TaxID=2486024 RepID=A0ABW1TJU5_9LACO|nr:TetR/AcrR family transcriptional regulator [Levilactobacillus fujinensis]
MKKSDQQRQNIIDVGRELFAEKGYAETSTRMINEQAGIAEGLLYYYFPKGKRQLLDTIVHEGIVVRKNMAEIQLQGWRSDNLEERVVNLFNTFWKSFNNDAGYQSFLITIRERTLLSDEQSQWLISTIAGVEKRIAVALREVDPRPERQERLADIAQLIMSIFQRTVYDELLIRDSRNPAAMNREDIRREIRLVLALV